MKKSNVLVLEPFKNVQAVEEAIEKERAKAKSQLEAERRGLMAETERRRAELEMGTRGVAEAHHRQVQLINNLQVRRGRKK